MNPEYALYSGTDRWFYDTPRRAGRAADGSGNANGSDGHRYALARRPAPEGWESAERGDWFSLAPAGRQLPAQGWKIHVSATPDNAEEVLETVAGICQERATAFKFLAGPALLLHRNTKYADRAGSGKFVTVYPATTAACGELAAELADALKGSAGPVVLSDLRWGEGPVHVRYGAFAPRFTRAADGSLVPAVADPAGRLVPDTRGPAFRLPDWVELPDFLRPHAEARAAQGTTDLPYTVERALHFSNGGGVYAGSHRETGEAVVLKEGRPHAGLAADGADAVTRLEREYAALRALEGLACVPRVHGLHTVGEHRFLAMEFIPGTPLNTVFARRFPLSAAEPAAEALAEHTAWALRTHQLVTEAVEALHARGIAFGDLHMNNIMVAPDQLSVTLLDFEAATPAAERRPQIVANPAFVAPPHLRGTEVDRYALACLRLALFVPLTTLLPLDRDKAAHLAGLAADRYGIDRALFDEAVTELAGPARPEAGPSRGRPPVSATDWPAARDSMVAALLASATPGRDDRYFPGDIAQFATPAGGQSYGYGAAGVLHALHTVGARCEEAEEWLIRTTRRPASGTPTGFYDGLTGIAWTLDRLGHREDALRLAHLVAAEPLDALGPGLHSGAPGVALALRDLADAADDPALGQAADRAEAAALRPAAPGGKAGLLHGPAGTALLCLRRHARTGEPALLDTAATALREELGRCVPGPDGSLVVSEARRTMPYLGSGSAGIAMVLDDYLAHRPDPAFEEARTALLRATGSAFYIQPGLFRGVAGLLLHLARTTTPGDRAARTALLTRQTALLDWHALTYQGHLAHPGEQLTRLSMDLSTGTAGVLLALAATHGEPAAHLPFLPPLRRPTDRP
ncbi:class III lanthionine synthetase LanKC [Streptomyces albidoflavus]